MLSHHDMLVVKYLDQSFFCFRIIYKRSKKVFALYQSHSVMLQANFACHAVRFGVTDCLYLYID